MGSGRRKRGRDRDPYDEMIRKVRTLICIQELFRLFPNANQSLTSLEWEVFRRTTHREDKKRDHYATFHRWLERNSYPDPATRSGAKTLEMVEKRLSERDSSEGPTDNRLREWATSPLWDCLFNGYSPFTQRELLSQLGPETREIIYHDKERLQGELVYFPLARLKSLNAFLALLLLSRELAELDRAVEAEVPAHLALAIFPGLIRKEPVLASVSSELADVIRAKYWTTPTTKGVAKAQIEKSRKSRGDIEVPGAWGYAYCFMNSIIGLRLLHKNRLTDMDVLAFHK